MSKHRRMRAAVTSRLPVVFDQSQPGGVELVCFMGGTIGDREVLVIRALGGYYCDLTGRALAGSVFDQVRRGPFSSRVAAVLAGERWVTSGVG